MKKILLFALVLLLGKTLSAQNTTGVITGKLVDSATKQPLGFATISVFEAKDTALITYRLSTPEGSFKIPNLPTGKTLRLLVSFSGYSVYRKEITLDANQSTIDIGTISMNSDVRALDDVLVIAERPPVSVRKDTIEFNAAAFKTLPTALVEDLLKKLPGVQVDADGNITVNGKKVNRILVDGKEFFGNDPKMATRNLPANVIEKIQVSADKDEKELNPDKPEGELGQVINLKFKKGIKKGWFGKAYAGGGTDDKYEAGSILNLFRDTFQVSLIGFTNNLNRAGFGFNDIRSLGGFDRSGMNMIWMNGNGGVNINGISFGGMGEGINTSTGGGFNTNTVLKNGITVNAQYFYGQTKNDIRETLNRQQFFGDTTLVSRSVRDEILKTFNHRFSLGFKGKIDSLTRFEFKPSLVISDQHSNKTTTTNTDHNYKGLLNTGNNKQFMQGDEHTYSHQFSFFKNFKKTGRTLNVFNTLNSVDIDNDQVNEAMLRFYQTAPPKDSLLEQLRAREQNSFNTNFNSNWNEPLNKVLNLRLGYALSYFYDKEDINIFNRDATNKYGQLNPNLSNGFTRDSWRNTLSAALNYKKKSLSITATGYYIMLDLYNQFKKVNGQVDQHYNFVLPGLSVNYKEFNMNYSANVAPPSLTDIQPTEDNSNPLFIIRGNSNLKPAVSHNVNFNYFKNIPTTTTFIGAYFNGSMRNDAIARNRVIQSNGVQISTPLNIDGVYNLYTNFNFNKQNKVNKNFQFTYGFNYNIDFSRNFLIVNDRKSYVKTLNVGPGANFSLNWKDKIEFNINHYRNFNRTNYESKSFTNLRINSYSVNSELVIRVPKNFVWESSIRYNYNSQAAPGIQRTTALWNGALTYLFLKDQKGQLKLSVFDILNQNINMYRTSSENYITDRQINMLQQYFLLTFTYNIRNFKAGKVGGTQRFFMF
jgi:hypothetical protein